ncbi:peroxiredoxin family protein [Rossellomorea marisflavi]|uniref:peroxiredoxin family protein n=1 Tax=Rossellomorea marisflavi TaxID=189381 RepID=UPI00296F2C64|nr:peroxiredoxin family protein [Rossellomorea marisflavi]MDW4525132.1 peroxiredoxin family protein [Rossellomorea marisflavi]
MATFQLKDTVPDFELPSVAGETFSFKQYQKEHDSWHLIVFFRGSWCPVCQEELREFQAGKEYFEKHSVHIIGISSDSLDNLKEMVDKEDITFPILSDEKLEAIKAFDVFYHGEDAPYEDHGQHGEPAYFLVNEKGEILYQQKQTGPFGRPHPNELRKTISYIQKNIKE